MVTVEYKYLGFILHGFGGTCLCADIHFVCKHIATCIYTWTQADACVSVCVCVEWFTFAQEMYLIVQECLFVMH